MTKKCKATGKVTFASFLEAKACMYTLKWNYHRRKDMFGKRIKHRQGKPAQRRVYSCDFCQGYHLTRWKKSHFNKYVKKTIEW